MQYKLFNSLMTLIGITNPFAGAVISGILLVFLCYISYRVFINTKEGIIWLLIISSLDVIGRVISIPHFGNVTVFHVVFLFFIAGWLVRRTKSGMTGLIKCPIFYPLVLFIALAGISLLYSPNRMIAVVDMIRLTALFLLFVIIVNIDYSGEEFALSGKVMIGLGVANVGLFCFQHFTHKLLVSSARVGISPDIPYLVRASGFFNEPNKFAVVLMCSFLVVLSMLLNGSRKRVFYSVMLFILGLSLFLTFSRSAWLATFAGCIIVLLFGKNPLKRIVCSVLVMVIIIFILSFTPRIGTFVRHRIKSLVHVKASSGLSVRRNMAISAVKMFRDHPFGIGWRGFPVVYPEYMLPGTPKVGVTGREHVITESHSLPFTILAELGIIGIILAVVLVYHVIKFMLEKNRIIHDEKIRTLFIGLCGIWGGFMVDFCFYSDLFNNYFWILFGLLIAAGRIFEVSKGVMNEE